MHTYVCPLSVQFVAPLGAPGAPLTTLLPASRARMPRRLTCIPGSLVYKGAKLQILDMPGIIEGAKDGKGRGRQVIGTARTCDMILIALDAVKPLTHKSIIEKELSGYGIRLNEQPPNVTFSRRNRGPIEFTHTITPTHLDEEQVKAICNEYRINSASICLHEDITADQLIDVIEGNR